MITMEIFDVFIFDLDGTLANHSHRMHYILDENNKDWDSFFKAVSKDKPIIETIDLFIHLKNGVNKSLTPTKIVIWTGRNEDAKEATEIWLNKNGIHPDELKMRKSGDHRPDYILKKEWLDEFKQEYPYARILGVFEDRDAVVKMWRDNGIICYQCNYGNF